jgi:hypothetical protein
MPKCSTHGKAMYRVFTFPSFPNPRSVYLHPLALRILPRRDDHNLSTTSRYHDFIKIRVRPSKSQIVMTLPPFPLFRPKNKKAPSLPSTLTLSMCFLSFPFPFPSFTLNFPPLRRLPPRLILHLLHRRSRRRSIRAYALDPLRTINV